MSRVVALCICTQNAAGHSMCRSLENGGSDDLYIVPFGHACSVDSFIVRAQSVGVVGEVGCPIHATTRLE
jgi:hypothetical protein